MLIRVLLFLQAGRLEDAIVHTEDILDKGNINSKYATHNKIACKPAIYVVLMHAG